MIRTFSICIPILVLTLIFVTRNYLSIDREMEPAVRGFLGVLTLLSIILIWSTFYVTRNWRDVKSKA